MHWPKERPIWNLLPNLEGYGATQENAKVTLRYGTGVALTLRCSCGSIQLSVNATPEQ